ncbi:hypothetical protein YASMINEVIRUS_136 [Yasminevirus sp. GU-2018]|uniref:Cache domain-containing protein n=1 Tax=Yasminevirus sp. GU-2018 TaxID=2420051 RepID=A0A5K0U8K7_9VIRU|nr:hypothetical protein YASMINEVIRUS_136 [Yasminevirus sp. GU-2018]
MGFLDKYSIRTQLLLLTILQYTAFLGLLIICCSVLITVSYNKLQNDSASSLESQVVFDVQKILTEKNAFLSTKFYVGEESLVKYLKYAARDTFDPNRIDQVIGFEDSYFDYGTSYLAQPMYTDTRQTFPVSLKHSSYYVPHTTPSNISSFSLELNKTRDSTAHLDIFFVNAYRSNIDFYSAYTSFDQFGLHRRYPGIDTLSSDPDRNYDPRVRGWYTSAVNSPTEVIYTSPYVDAHGRGVTITMATVINDQNGQFVGVVGGDMSIKTINENVKGIKFFTTGKLILFDSSGKVISGNYQDGENSDTAVDKTYKDVTPTISDDVWSSIVNVDVDNTSVVSDGTTSDADVVMIATRLPNADGKYYLVAFLSKSEIYAPIDKVAKNLTSTMNMQIGVIVGVSIGIAILVILLVLWMGSRLTTPLVKIGQMASQMVDNLGGDDITEGVVQIDIKEGFGREQYELNKNMNAMVSTIQEWREEGTAEDQNKYYCPVIPQNYVPHNVTYQDGVKIAPPSYEETMMSRGSEKKSNKSNKGSGKTTELAEEQPGLTYPDFALFSLPVPGTAKHSVHLFTKQVYA